MSIRVRVLGSCSAIPTAQRFPTSQLINIDNSYFLVDCGEGAQIQLRKYEPKFLKINHIFISHLHGDHFFGLIGLLSTMNLMGRKTVLHIYGPQKLKQIIDFHIKISEYHFDYKIHFFITQTEKPEIIYEDKKLIVETLILKHKIPCTGFLFKEKPKLRNILKEQIRKYKIPVKDIPSIKEGKDFILPNGTVISNKDMTTKTTKEQSYAFCSDTAYNQSLIPQLMNVDLLYHEATYTKELSHLAQTTLHSTAEEAARIALQANAKKLILGHFSSRYKKVQSFLTEATKIFPNTVLANEGEEYQP